MSALRRFQRVAAVFIAMSATLAVRAQDAAETTCREHLEVLGAAYGRYLVMTGGRPPERMSDLYRQGLVLDLDTFTCPAAGNRIADAKQIDEKTDYTIATNLTDRTPMLLFQEKKGIHEGQALSYYSDRTFRKTAPPPQATNSPSPDVGGVNGPTAVAPTNQIARILAWDAVGKEQYRVGKWAAAESAFREAIRLDPTNTWHSFNLGLSLAQQGRWSEAEGAYSNAVLLNGSYAPAQDQLGHAYFNQSKWPAAAVAYRAAIQLDSTNGSYRAHLGATLRLQTNWMSAEASYREASRLDPDNAQYHVEVGHLCLQQGRWNEAGPQYLEAIRLDPNNAWAHGGMGHVYLAQNRLTEAEQSYRTAIRLNPQFGQFSADLAGALLRAGRAEEARRAAQEAIRLGFRQHWSFSHLGLTP